jgi:hypothetical protein
MVEIAERERVGSLMQTEAVLAEIQDCFTAHPNPPPKLWGGTSTVETGRSLRLLMRRLNPK